MTVLLICLVILTFSLIFVNQQGMAISVVTPAVETGYSYTSPGRTGHVALVSDI